MISSAPRVIERAFDLARSGRCKSIEDIRRELRREQHSNIDAHLAGGSIRKQLAKLMANAKEESLPRPIDLP